MLYEKTSQEISGSMLDIGAKQVKWKKNATYQVV